MDNHWQFWSAEDEPLPAAVADWQFDAALPQPWPLRSPGAFDRGPDGRWTSYPANTPRPYHAPVTRVLRGILVEPARFQLVYNSRPFAPTSLFAAPIVADSTVQTPFGIGAVLLRADNTAATHG
ncbi:hypothetical protein JL101_036280 (plasmid) [Skermanella rosea]|uniref:hypothetical protein n=1 Tax=Skermanella rosea TaxID=1817965 RepID=UPI001933EF23